MLSCRSSVRVAASSAKAAGVEPGHRQRQPRDLGQRVRDGETRRARRSRAAAAPRSRRPAPAGPAAPRYSVALNSPVERSTSAAPTTSSAPSASAVRPSSRCRVPARRPGTIAIRNDGSRASRYELIGEGAGRHHADDLALDEALGRPRVFDLLADGDAKPLADEPRQVAVGRVIRHAAHRNAVAAGVLRPRRERQIESARRDERVLVEHLVEVAHPEEDDGVPMLALGVEILPHRRRGGGGGGHRRGAADSWPARRAEPRQSYYRVIPMIILALDTSTRTGSCAVLRGGDVLAELPGDASPTHAERLPGDLMAVLDRAGLRAARRGGVRRGDGPRVVHRSARRHCHDAGAGARRGPAARRRVAYSTRWRGPRPARGTDRRIATWVDAWRGEVFAALYEGVREVEGASVELPQAILARLGGTPTLFIGDGAAAHREAIGVAMGPHGGLAPVLEPPLAGIIGRLARAEIDARRPPGSRRHPAALRAPARLWSWRGTPVSNADDARLLDGAVRRARRTSTASSRSRRSRSPTPGRGRCTSGSCRTARSATSSWSARRPAASPGSARSGSSWTRFTSTTWRSGPECRGRGLGTRLMRRVLAEGRRLGATRATLEVRASNDAARRFYERLGFRGHRRAEAVLHESRGRRPDPVARAGKRHRNGLTRTGD